MSIWVEALLPETFTPVPDHAYFTVRLGLKLDPLAVAVTGSPGKDFRWLYRAGRTGWHHRRSAAEHKHEASLESHALRTVVGVVAEGPYR